MKQIALTKGKFALVDDEDFDRLSAHKWNSHSGGYAVRQEGNYYKGTRKIIYMHQEVMGQKFIDHINHDKLDNQKKNLRVASKAQNTANIGLISTNTTGYRGVSKHRNSFHAYIAINKKRINIGYFKTALEAAKARDVMAKKLYGEFAYLNLKEAA